MVVIGKNCSEINEYVHRDGDCRECPRCIKGYGINITQKIKHSDRGMLSCYSCYKCPQGFYQDEYVLKCCKQCDKCKHRQILRNCSEIENRICGDCLPGYFIQSNKRSIICDENAADFITGNNSPNVPAIILGICFAISLLGYIWLWIKKKNWFKEMVKSLRGVFGRKEEDLKDCNKNENNAEEPLFKEKEKASGDCKKSNSKNEYCNDKPLEEASGDCKKSNSKNEYFNDKPLEEASGDSLIHMPLVQHTEDDFKCNRLEEAIKANLEQYEAVDDNKFALGIGKDWKGVAHLLNFKVAEIEDIEYCEKQLSDCAFAVIRTFRRKNTSQENELTQALIDIKRFDLLKCKEIIIK